MSVRAIDAATVRKICSGQVILDVCSAVKELVENALDAGATTVSVKLLGSGLRLIEVSDNGAGISKENHASVALPHWTSKLSSFDDLQAVCCFAVKGKSALAFIHSVVVDCHSFRRLGSAARRLRRCATSVARW